MTTCRDGCGACCDPVTMAFTAREIAMGAAGDDDELRAFVRDSLTQLSRREGLARAPWLRGRTLVQSIPTGVSIAEAGLDTAAIGGVTRVLGAEVFYECRWFDRTTRACTNYDGRPAMCRRYPWGDITGPREAAALPPMCSFNADVGKPVGPIPVEWSPRR